MKARMTSLLLSLLPLSQAAWAQIVVSDPAGLTQSIVNSSDQIAQQAATTEQVFRTYEQTRNICIQQQRFFETLRKVSSAVRSMDRIERITEDVRAVTRMYSSSFSRISSSPLYTAGEIAAVADSYTRLMTQAGEELCSLRRILEDNAFSMSDAERMAAIERCADRTRRLRTLTSYFTSRTLSVASARRFLGYDAERMYGYMTR